MWREAPRRGAKRRVGESAGGGFPLPQGGLGGVFPASSLDNI